MTAAIFRRIFARAAAVTAAVTALSAQLFFAAAAHAHAVGEYSDPNHAQPHRPVVTRILSADGYLSVEFKAAERGTRWVTHYDVRIQAGPNCATIIAWHDQDKSCWLSPGGGYTDNIGAREFGNEPHEGAKYRVVVGLNDSEASRNPAPSYRVVTKEGVGTPPGFSGHPSQYNIQVRAGTFLPDVGFRSSREWYSDWSVVQKVTRNVPAPPQMLDYYYLDGRIHVRWAASRFPDWFPLIHREVDGYTLRYRDVTARAGWPEYNNSAHNPHSGLSASGDPDAVHQQLYIDYNDASVRTASFAVKADNTYAMQLSAHYGGAHRGWWSPIYTLSTNIPPLFQSGAGAARARQPVTPQFALHTGGGTHTFDIGPVAPDHDHATISLLNTGAGAQYKALLYNVGGSPSVSAFSDALTGVHQWTNIPLDGASPTLYMSIGADARTATNHVLRVHRLTTTGKLTQPLALTLSAQEYTESGRAKPQIVARWRPHPLAEGYSVTCQEISDPANPQQRCEGAAFSGIRPPTAADGMLRYRLRNAFAFGENARVNVAAVYAGAAGEFALATVTFRNQRSGTALRSLSLDHANTGGATYELTPAFHAERLQYTLRVDYKRQVTTAAAADALQITAVPQDANAQRSFHFPPAANTAVGRTDTRIIVEAEDGSAARTYTVGIVRYPNIHSLEFLARDENGGVVSTPSIPTPAFRAHAEENVYTYDVPFAAAGGTFQFSRFDADADAITFTDSQNRALTAVTGSGDGTESRARYAISIPIGGEIFTLTAENAERNFRARYQFRFLRTLAPSNDASLHTLSVTAAAAKRKLNPPFAAGVFTYDITASTPNLRIAATAQKRARVTLNQRDFTAAADVHIARGATPLELEVTAENGGVARYLLRVWYPPPGDALLIPEVTALSFNGGTYALSPAFSKTAYTYAVSGIPRAATFTVVTAAAESGVSVQARTTRGGEYANVDAAGLQLRLQPGVLNQLLVRTSAVGKETTVYSVYADVQAPLSEDATLHTIFARDREHAIAFAQSGQGATRGAGFAAAHLNYAAEVLQTAQSVFLTATAHELASLSVNAAAALSGEEREVTLQANADTRVEIVVTAEKGGTQTYAFTFTRRSGDTEPLAPRNVTLTAADAALQAVWDAPGSDGGDAVRTYFVRHKESDAAVTAWAEPPGETGAAVTPAAGGGATTFALAGLSPGVRYDVQVAAANTVGRSAWAAARGVAGGVVLLPPQLTLLSDDAKLIAEWNTPLDSTGAAAAAGAYRIRHAEGAGSVNWANPAGEPAPAAGSGSAHRYEIRNLQNATAYEVQIAAVHAVTGRGPWSASESATPSARVLGMPQNLQGASGNHRITLQWQPPAVGAPQMFRVRWADAGMPVREWNNRDGETFSPQRGDGGEYLIRGLQPGVTYEVQVAAEDDTGRGDWASTTVALGAFSLDANADGKITAADGIIVARYLLGVDKDGGLFAGQIPPGLTDAQKAVLLENLSTGKSGKYLDVVGDGSAEPDDKDGLAVARYLLGLPDAGGGGGDADAVGTAIEALMAQ